MIAETYTDRVWKAIREVLSNSYFLSIEELMRPCRKRDLVDLRKIVMYYLRENTNCTTIEIGKLTRRDHATVIHNIKDCKSLLEYDKVVQRDYARFSQLVKREIK